MWWVTNCVTIARSETGPARTPTDAESSLTSTFGLVGTIRAYLRDEEAVGSNPATPTTENPGQARYPRVGAGPDWFLRD
ncbi:hypothetical protein GCM10023321_04200 [Pseudonocardia eucalypti]|uniref:Uncharacterized protein n=1 Tax=Pseudonocardia eucalypti TaxID=648755 RepID=A0ABP9PIS2_9PSEU